MRCSLSAVLVALCLLTAAQTDAPAADDPKEPLQGMWLTQSLEADGKLASAEVLKRMRFNFKADKLLIKGNFDDSREEECTYKLDPKQSPKHLDFTPATEKKPVLAIYEVTGDDLKICLRHGNSSKGRPTEFATKADSQLVLMVFKKQKP
jgi:uncharacterized protein (TIGR03067 family)